MKIKGYSRDRSPKPCKLGSCTFYVKPLDQNLTVSLQGRMIGGVTDLFTNDVKRYFAEHNVTGWDNVESDDGEAVEYAPDVAVKVLTDEENDDLFYELYNFAYQMSAQASQAQAKDIEAAEKK